MKTILSYSDIYEFDIKLMKMVIKEYGKDEKAWNIFYEFYKDPDGYPIKNDKYKMVGDIKCTVDGLLSVNRIKQHERDFGENFVNAFIEYRKTPVIYFPSEKNGINISRSLIFGDRIDHTLFDLKRKCEEMDCKLETAYNLPKTSEWLKKFDNSFKEIVKWLEIEGIFVNEEYEVFDLEYSDGSIIKEYCKSYSKDWSERYYDNIKKKIKEYEKNVCQNKKY